MAKDEAKVTFRADAGEFDAAIKKASSTIRELRSGVRLCDAQMDAAGVSVEALRRKEDLLGQENTQLNAKVAALSAKHREAITLYGANSTQAQKLAVQLNNARSAVARNEAAIKSNNTALESAVRAEQQADSALAKLTAEVARQEHEMGLLGQEYRELVLTQGKESTEVKQLEAQMTSLNRDLQQNRSIVREADKAAEEFGRTLNETGDRANDAGVGFTTLRGIVSNLASTVFQRGIDKARELAREVLNIGMGFETSMAKVQALSGATDAEYQMLEQAARQYGATTRFTASQVADGFGYMALAGWDASSMLSGIPGILNLAAAAEMDLAEASDIVTDYLTAFGLKASDSEKFVDQMTYAMANSNTNVEQLGEAYKNCAATASSMHYSVEDVTGALMVMANAGVKGGEAGTALNSIMTRLATDTKGCATELAKYGVQVYDAEGNMKSLSSILNGMGGVWRQLSDEEQAALAKTIAGTNHYSNLQTVMKGVSDEAAASGQGLMDYSQALEDCAGSAQQMSDIMMDTAQGDLYTMQSALEEVGLKVYERVEAPLRSLIQFVSGPVVSGLTALIENARHIPPVLAGIAAGLVALKSRTADATALQRAQAALSRAFDTSAVACSRITKEVVNGQAAYVKYNAATKTSTVMTGSSTAAIKVQQGALKAQALAMKAGTVAARGLSAALKAIAPMAALTLAIEVITRASEELGKAAERSRSLEKATSGLTGAVGAAREAYSSYDGTVSASTDSLAASAKSTEECIEAVGQLADKMSETWADYGTNAAMVDTYAETIAELASKGELGTLEQERLKAAVDGFNKATGSSISIIDAQTGKLSESTEAILANAEAYKAEARAQAAREMYQENARQVIETEMALKAAKEEVATAQERLSTATNNFELANYSGQLRNAEAEANDLASVLNSLYYSQNELLEMTASSADSFASFDDALASAKVSLSDFGDIGEGQMAALREGFDGSLSSIVATCAQKGIAIPSSLASAIAANRGVAEGAQRAMLDAMVLQMTNGDVDAAAKALGHDIDQGLVDGITGASDMPSEAVGLMSAETIEAARAALDSHSPSREFEAIGGDIPAGEAIGIASNSHLAIDASGQMADDSVEAARVAVGEGMQGAGAKGVASFSGGILGGVGSALGAGMAAAQNAVAGSQTGTDGATSAGSALSDAFGRGVSAGAARLPGVGSRLSKSAMSGLGQGSSEAGSAGKETSDAYIRPIESANAQPAANRLRKGATDELSRGASKASSSGRFLGQSFIVGMQSTLGGVISAARKLARSAINAIKQEGGEGSPWKETKPSGRFAVQGFIEGEQSEAAALIDANRRIARSAVDALSPEGLGIAWHRQLASLAPAARPASVSAAVEAALPIAAITYQVEARLDDGGVGERMLGALEELGERQTVMEIDGEAVGRIITPNIDAMQGQRMAMQDWGLAL